MLNEEAGNEDFKVIERKKDGVREKGNEEPSNTKYLGNVHSGNLLSNITPPIALPSFITQPILEISKPPEKLEGKPEDVKEVSSVGQDSTFPTINFSAAIPPSKGIQHEVEQVNTKPQLQEAESIGIFDWVRDAVANNTILTKVAEKAKNSVDSMITTLDPQMKEFIYTGGSLEILVASTQEFKISAVKEAFQMVFGKARIEGIEVEPKGIAVQPVGFQAGIKGAEERIENVMKNPKLQKLFPVIAIEGFILEATPNRWYFLDAILLNDPVKHISLQTFTQMTPIPSEIIEVAKSDTPQNYEFINTGFSASVGQLMGNNLQVSSSEWHKTLTGIPRRDMILSSAKSLAYLYKNSIA